MEDFGDWLIGYRWRGKSWSELDPSESPLVTRCPQHATRWSAEVIGLGNTRRTHTALREARERDAERLSEQPTYGMDLPFMLPQTLERTLVAEH